MTTTGRNGKTMNRTAELTPEERGQYKPRLSKALQQLTIDEAIGKVFCQDIAEVLPQLPAKSVDLLFLDPPYNLTKDFNGVMVCAADALAEADCKRVRVRRLALVCAYSNGRGKIPDASQPHNLRARKRARSNV
jgi:16S rRNA G966 N2-methylase RsmD